MTRIVTTIAATSLAALAISACGSTKTVTSTTTKTATEATSTTASSTETTTGTTTQSATVSKTCTVNGVSGVSGGTVSVQLNASGYDPAVSNLVGCTTASTLVKLIAAKRSQMPVQTQNFNCTPTVNGNSTDFACALSAGKGKIDYQFTLNYS